MSKDDGFMRLVALPLGCVLLLAMLAGNCIGGALRGDEPRGTAR